MKGHRQKTLALVLAVSLGFAARTDAFLGIGDIVFDPSNFAQAVEQVIRLEQQTLQLIRSYEMLRLQYEQLVRSARRVPVDMAARYRAALTPWRTSSATNTYGTTAPWVLAANSGLNIPGAYSQVTEPLRAYGLAFDAPLSVGRVQTPVLAMIGNSPLTMRSSSPWRSRPPASGANLRAKDNIFSLPHIGDTRISQ
jgi:hypothetical protein